MSTRTSIITKLAKEVGELSDDAVRALRPDGTLVQE